MSVWILIWGVGATLVTVAVVAGETDSRGFASFLGTLSVSLLWPLILPYCLYEVVRGN